MDLPYSVAVSRLASGPPAVDNGLQPRYAESARELEALLQRTILAVVPIFVDATVVGLTISAGGSPTDWVGMVHFGANAMPNLAREIPAAQAVVLCEECACSDQALAECATRLWDRLATLPLSTTASQIFEVQVAAAGSAPKLLVALLGRIVGGS